MALMSASRCSPEPARECSSMFFTIESARLPCWTTLSRLPQSNSVTSAICSFPCSVMDADCMISLSSSTSSRDRAAKLFTKLRRVFDLMRDAGGQLAERRELLCLNQPLLRGSELFERFCQFPGPSFNVLEQARVLNGKHGLGRERLEQVDRRAWEHTRFFATHHKRAYDSAGPKKRNNKERAIACGQDEIAYR